MLTIFNSFINENNETNNNIYKLYIEPDINNEKSSWDLSIDLSELWKNFNNKTINIESFIKKFKLKINEYKDQIILIDVNIWNNLVIILNKLKDFDEESMYNTLTNVYNWGDENNIEIKTN
jgi:hypothetical protein